MTLGIGLLGVWAAPQTAYAVVGKAEEFDEFTQEDLEAFQAVLLTEEKSETAKKIERYQDLTAADKKTTDKEAKDEIQALRQEVLSLPERDLLKFGAKFNYTFDFNVDRTRKFKVRDTDSIFDLDLNMIIDLSGRKTQFSLETVYGRRWNWIFSERDFYQVGERFRYRRPYGKKIKHAAQLNLNRHNSKTVEVDTSGGKLRYDIGTRNTFNWQMTRKMGWNFDFSTDKRLFTQEPFDQDSQWQASASPSFLWNLTPKSQISGSYKFGASRIRSKAGDSNSHDIAIKYFGKITRKSSASINFARQRQTRRSNETARISGTTVGIGYIFQLTPKTQLTTQFIRNVQNTSSDAAGDDGTTIRTDSTFQNNSLTISLNSKLNKKLSANISFTPSFLSTDTFTDGDKSAETQQWNWPLNVGFRFIVTRWLQVTMGYDFNFRRDKSNISSFKTHVFKFGVNANF